MRLNKGLDSLERLGWRFGLDSMKALLRELGDPQSSLRFIHVAGSNGKGSTCAFTASLLQKAGYRAGLYTSPHLSDLRERFRLDGAWISSRDLTALSRQVLRACAAVQRHRGHSPTHFEALTALAFLWFKKQKADLVVLEVGLGGRLDATNVIERPEAALIAPVSLEHQDILGRSLSKIAWEKAGILKEGGLAATVQKNPRALAAIRRAAKERGASLWAAGEDFYFKPTPRGFLWEGPGLSHEFHLPLMPGYQAGNAALAVAGIQLLRARGLALETPAIQKALAATRWPGRLERLGPHILMDGAHNPEAFGALAQSLRLSYPGRRWVVLNGFLSDKNYEACV
ncbi:MAG TPA: folylpolyglutamate synthase/dihydrofolate synthase family protein, partial [bacterium]|nr:folylpolyglutamate synthase/dihydrofolate synthase family protein [bacterium]